MVRNKTLIVVGAGASHEIGMPTGPMLKATIAKLLDIRYQAGRRATGDELIGTALQIIARQGVLQESSNRLLQTCWHISSAMPQASSIDSFIDNHRDNKAIALCGKLAIVRSILEAEKRSKLYVDAESIKSSPDYSFLEKTWFGTFMKLLVESCSVDELNDRLALLTFIVFNYDRCVEYFLYNAIKNYYGISEKSTADLVERIKILHPYGTVGKLSWQHGEMKVNYGDDINEEELYRLTSGIKTFAEGTDTKSSDIDEIRKSVVEAKITLFLGFAFHRQNLQLLKPTERLLAHAGPSEYYATAFGYSAHNARIIGQDIVGLLEKEPRTLEVRRDLKCSELLDEYSRTLSLSFR